MLNANFPLYGSLFRFMVTLKSEVISRGLGLVEQAAEGLLPKRAKDKAAIKLEKLSYDAEKHYMEGSKKPKDLLRLAACHYDDEKLIRTLNSISSNEVIAEREESDSFLRDEDEALLSVQSVEESMEVDDREEALESDEGLRDIDDDIWVSARWENTETGKNR